MSTDPPLTTRQVLGYGWVIVVVAAIAMVATLPGRTHGLGMITERLLADSRFGLDRVSYSDINLWATLLGGLFCLPCGWLIDRFGLRITLAVTVSGLAAAVLAMCHTDDVRLFSLAILLTRGFGQSALSVISITMVAKWFPGGLSLPMAVYSLLLSLGFASAAQLAKPWATADWRVLWSGIGYLVAGFVPVALLLTREPPPQVPTSDDIPCCGDASTHGFTLPQALRTQAFWVFGLAISLIALIGSGVSLFNESVLRQQGFPVETFYNLITLSGTVGLLVKLPVGWLGQYCRLNRMLAAGLALQALCMVLLPTIHTVFGITLYGIGMGIAGTITTVLFFTIWGQAFGRAHVGQIQSVAQMMTVLASALGPRVFAECFARLGSYNLAFQILAGLTGLLALWSWTARVPNPYEAPRPLPEITPAPRLQEI